MKPGASYPGRAVRIAVLWLAWIYAGIVTFGIPRRISEKTDLVTALANASEEVKVYAGIWILGSIVLCAFLMTTLRKAFGKRKAPKTNR